jgi:hypothetical protein
VAIHCRKMKRSFASARLRINNRAELQEAFDDFAMPVFGCNVKWSQAFGKAKETELTQKGHQGKKRRNGVHGIAIEHETVSSRVVARGAREDKGGVVFGGVWAEAVAKCSEGRSHDCRSRSPFVRKHVYGSPVSEISPSE